MGKPDWDKLMDAFADSETQLVGDADCTADGKDLCAAQGVKGYPTIKRGGPGDLQDYKGGRDYDSLEKFAKESLKPLCSPKNVGLCEDDKKPTPISRRVSKSSKPLTKTCRKQRM